MVIEQIEVLTRRRSFPWVGIVRSDVLLPSFTAKLGQVELNLFRRLGGGPPQLEVRHDGNIYSLDSISNGRSHVPILFGRCRALVKPGSRITPPPEAQPILDELERQLLQEIRETVVIAGNGEAIPDVRILEPANRLRIACASLFG